MDTSFHDHKWPQILVAHWRPSGFFVKRKLFTVHISCTLVGKGLFVSAGDVDTRPADLLWKKTMLRKFLFGLGWEKIRILECPVLFHRRQGLFLSVYVDWHQKWRGKKQNITPMWEDIDEKNVDIQRQGTVAIYDLCLKKWFYTSSTTKELRLWVFACQNTDGKSSHRGTWHKGWSAERKQDANNIPTGHAGSLSQCRCQNNGTMPAELRWDRLNKSQTCRGHTWTIEKQGLCEGFSMLPVPSGFWRDTHEVTSLNKPSLHPVWWTPTFLMDCVLCVRRVKMLWSSTKRWSWAPKTRRTE